jgi:hypothetical protein
MVKSRFTVGVRPFDPVTVVVNGVTLCDSTKGDVQCLDERWTQWVLPGRNLIELHVHGGSTPVQARIEASVVRTEDKSTRSLGTESCTLQALPGTCRLEVDVVAEIPPCDLFTEAEVLPNDAATRAAVLDFARDYYAAWSRRDAAALTAMDSYKLAETMRCRGIEGADVHGLGEARSLEHDSLEPLGEGLRARQVANGRVFHVTRGAEPLIEGTARGGRLQADVFIARVDGHWAVVR